MNSSQLKNYMSRYKITTAKLAGLLGLTRNYIHHMRSGIDAVPPWIETAIQEIATGHYIRKPENLTPRERRSLENQIIPYLRNLTNRARQGYYEIY